MIVRNCLKAVWVGIIFLASVGMGVSDDTLNFRLKLIKASFIEVEVRFESDPSKDGVKTYKLTSKDFTYFHTEKKTDGLNKETLLSSAAKSGDKISCTFKFRGENDIPVAVGLCETLDAKAARIKAAKTAIAAKSATTTTAKSVWWRHFQFPPRPNVK